MQAKRDRDHGSRSAMLLALGALAWSVLLLPAALLVPVYASQTTDSRGETVARGRTLVEVNGASALIPVAVVVITAAVGAAALARRQGRPGVAARRVALGAASALLLLGAVGAASIGIFVLPAGIALAVGSLSPAWALNRRPRRRSSRSRRRSATPPARDRR